MLISQNQNIATIRDQSIHICYITKHLKTPWDKKALLIQLLRQNVVGLISPFFFFEIYQQVPYLWQQWVI